MNIFSINKQFVSIVEMSGTISNTTQHIAINGIVLVYTYVCSDVATAGKFRMLDDKQIV